jgi:DNA repair protein RadD
VVNVQALQRIDPKVVSDIELVIIDEYHHSSADGYLEINETHLRNCYHRIGLTATNFRNDGADLALEAILSNVLYEYSIHKAIEDGFLMAPKFKIIEMPLGKGKTYQHAYKEQIVNNPVRNGEIANIAKDHKEDHVLILVKQVEHGEILKELIPDSEFIHGGLKDLDRNRMMANFREGKLKCLIGTSVIGEGVDLPIADVLIIGGGGKAKSQVIQNVGRVLRIKEGKTKAIIYDFTDKDGKWLEEHSDLRQEIYNQEYPNNTKGELP